MKKLLQKLFSSKTETEIILERYWEHRPNLIDRGGFIEPPTTQEEWYLKRGVELGIYASV